MAEEFEDVDLGGAEFWAVNLRDATFRDVDFSGVRVSHSRLVDVGIDGLVEGLVVNGVDVTDFVNEHDPWFPLRGMLRPTDPHGVAAAWGTLQAEWDATIDDASSLTDEQLHRSVDGEWSFVRTLRHLVFCFDKWFAHPVLGNDTFEPIGQPNTGSVGFPWPGLDADHDPDPTLDEVLAVRRRQHEAFTAQVAAMSPSDLTGEAEVLENGTVPRSECYLVVLEEEFEHLRYARRDLAILTADS